LFKYKAEASDTRSTDLIKYNEP